MSRPVLATKRDLVWFGLVVVLALGCIYAYVAGWSRGMRLATDLFTKTAPADGGGK